MASFSDSHSLVQSELGPGENGVWFGKPDPTRVILPSLVKMTAICLAIAYYVANAMQGTRAAYGLAISLAVLIGLELVGFIIFGLGIRAALIARKTVYAITNKRILVLIPNRAGVIVAPYPVDNFSNVKSFVLPNGKGDVTFIRKAGAGTTGGKSGDLKLVGVARARDVEEVARRTFGMR
jgi:hypothetical protein